MAIHFKHSKKHYFITTNFKVCFSTLSYHKELYHPSKLSIFINALVRKISKRVGLKHYYLVRNPYDRLESFYRDKLYDAPNKAVFSEDFRWQFCQDLIIEKFGNSEWSFFQKKEFLLSISFEQFIFFLDKIYLSDRHLSPQRLELNIIYKKWILPIHFDCVLRVEEASTVEFLRNELNINTSIKRNFTKDLPIQLTWTRSMREIANNIYEEDFKNFGYPMIV